MLLRSWKKGISGTRKSDEDISEELTARVSRIHMQGSVDTRLFGPGQTTDVA
jgi:hypothetical protein